MIEVEYKSVFNELPYIKQKVLIEIGARSLLEPAEDKEMQENMIYGSSLSFKKLMDKILDIFNS